MVDGGRDEFDDLDMEGPSARRGRGGRSVIVDDSYGGSGGGYMGRSGDDDGGGRDPDFSEPASRSSRSAGGRAAARFDDADDGVGERGEPDFDFDAVKRSKGRGTSRASAGSASRGRASGAGETRASARRAAREERAEARSRSSRGGGARRDLGDSAGGVWAIAFLASVLWVAGVCAFAVGYFRMPTSPAAALIDAAAALEPRFALMTLAVAIGPLGVIWTAALTARRARTVAAEARRLGEIGALVSSGGGGAADADIDMGGLRADLERARAAVDALSASLVDAEARAEDARERLAADRESMATLLNDVGGEAARLNAAIEELRAVGGPAGGGGVDATALAETVAAAVAARVPVQAPAPAAAPTRFRDDGPDRSSPTRSAVMRAAEAAAVTLGRGGGYQDPAEAPAPATERVGGYDDDPYAAAGRFADDGGRFSDDDDVDEAFDPEYDDDPEADMAGAAVGGLDWSKFVRAANFPESEEDQATLDALYSVIKDPEVAALLQSAEDVLSALADVDLFMDDMQPHHAPSERWRAYIVEGDARDAIDLGGVRDPHAIEDAAAALRDRDGFEAMSSAFLDRYEALLERLFREAPSPKLAVELADTRSGRAYMLLARAAGRLG